MTKLQTDWYRRYKYVNEYQYTGVESGGARGAAAPLNAGRRGVCPPTNLRQWISETMCEIKLPAVIHSGMAQKRIESFFAPAPRRTATLVQGKLALPGAWRMPRLYDTGGVACVVQSHARDSLCSPTLRTEGT